MRTNELSSKDELMNAFLNDFMIDELAQIEATCNAAIKLKSCYITANIVPLNRIKCSVELKSCGSKCDITIKKLETCTLSITVILKSSNLS